MKALDDVAARQALVIPSESSGVSWHPDAADYVVRETGGYSYFIQEYGSAVWDTAEQSPIGMDDVQRAEVKARRSLDEGFFKARWDRATDAQKEYLQAMAEYGDKPAATSDIADRLRSTPTRLAPRRSELIMKGLIYSPSRGNVAFTVPNMGDFIRRQEPNQ